MFAFPALHLPALELNKEGQIYEKEGKYYIIDLLRKKHLLLTPEEWVRQHVVQWLMACGYPKGMMSLESSQKLSLQRRYDLLVFDKNKDPFLLVECKASHIKISSDSFQQILSYNLSLQAPYILVTNGLKIFILSKTDKGYAPLSNLPPYL
ncbi:type I restriction enzyme HsdR N-terminal domain-containing protein [Hugenholtzia roseola]|uniref:type I restriction enzyme HsdR N-terminal domain-containing protein n=1 Tax=Hugenholtzia roseola TaxID=1002 RepID=UPI00040CB477|nr:type I restriction enzyme HsdR N-terminal domain-containing protein [Hugenholtzia roseola]